MSMPQILTILLIGAGLLSFGNVRAAQERPYYMWVDEDGVFNFSQMQPRNRQADEVKEPPTAPRPGGPVSATEEETAAPQSPGLSFSTKQEAEAQEHIAQMDEASAQAREVNCTLGRRSLEKLNRFRNIFMKGDDGLWRELTPERRTEEVAKAESLIAENC